MKNALEIVVHEGSIYISTNFYSMKQTMNIELPQYLNYFIEQEKSVIWEHVKNEIIEFLDKNKIESHEIFLVHYFFNLKNNIYYKIKREYPESEI